MGVGGSKTKCIMKTSIKTNNLILYITILCLAIFASCSKNDDTKPDDNPANYSTLIVGKWKIITAVYFQEDSKDKRELSGKDEDYRNFEFTQDGKIKTDIDPKGKPYIISENQLYFNESDHIITKLDKKNLVFEKIVGINVEQAGKIGTLYGVYTGIRVTE
jgi:hypothetical protein